MKQGYRLINDHEPTEAQLRKLMHEVAVEAKQRAAISNKKLQEAIAQATLTVLQKKRDENKK